MHAADPAGLDPRPGSPRAPAATRQNAPRHAPRPDAQRPDAQRRDAPRRGQGRAKTVPEPTEIQPALTRIAHEIIHRTNGGCDMTVPRDPSRECALRPRQVTQL